MSLDAPAWNAAWAMLRRAGMAWAGLPPQDELPDGLARQLGASLEQVRAQLLDEVPQGPYLETDASAAAYTLALAPRTVAAVLRECSGLPPPRRVLDLGAGLGAASLALLALGAREFTLVDTGARALQRAASMLREAGAARVDVHVGNLAQGIPVTGDFDVVVAAFSMLEAAGEDPTRLAELARQASQRVAKGGCLLLLDSAQKERARLINGLRTPLLEAGLHLWAPCPHAGPCPALERARDFCHAAVPWNLPMDLARFGEAQGLHRHRLTYSRLVLGWAARTDVTSNTLVIGDPHKEKGRARLAVCSALPVRELQALSRHKDAHRALLELERGTRLELPPAGDEVVVRVEDPSWLSAR